MTIYRARNKWNETNILIMGIHAHNENKTIFFKGLMEKIIDMTNENWCLQGDWNGVICSEQIESLILFIQYCSISCNNDQKPNKVKNRPIRVINQ